MWNMKDGAELISSLYFLYPPIWHCATFELWMWPSILLHINCFCNCNCLRDLLHWTETLFLINIPRNNYSHPNLRLTHHHATTLSERTCPHTWYLSISVHRHIILASKKYTEECVNLQQNRLNWWKLANISRSLYMSHSQMFQKVESGGGPIFKVALEC